MGQRGDGAGVSCRGWSRRYIAKYVTGESSKNQLPAPRPTGEKSRHRTAGRICAHVRNEEVRGFDSPRIHEQGWLTPLLETATVALIAAEPDVGRLLPGRIRPALVDAPEGGQHYRGGGCGVRAGRAVVGVVVWSCRDHGSGWSEVLAKS